jgi:photosynthesis system II assembly factor YCF48-like protein
MAATHGRRSSYPQHTARRLSRASAFADANHGWFSGPRGRVFRTVDGGQTWRVEPLPAGVSVVALGSLNSNRAWAVGGNASGQGLVVACTTTDGNAWDAIPAAPPGGQVGEADHGSWTPARVGRFSPTTRPPWLAGASCFIQPTGGTLGLGSCEACVTAFKTWVPRSPASMSFSSWCPDHAQPLRSDDVCPSQPADGGHHAVRHDARRPWALLAHRPLGRLGRLALAGAGAGQRLAASRRDGCRRGVASIWDLYWPRRTRWKWEPR